MPPPKITKPYTPLLQNDRLKWIQRISYLMDEQFRFPGTSFRFGLDPVLNIFPVLGDLSGFIVSTALVLLIAKKGASSKIVVLMCFNIVLDATIGAIPVIGQVFDFFYKANSMNVRLVKEHYLEGKHQGSGKNALLIIGITLVISGGLIVYGAVKLIGVLVDWL